MIVHREMEMGRGKKGRAEGQEGGREGGREGQRSTAPPDSKPTTGTPTNARAHRTSGFRSVSEVLFKIRFLSACDNDFGEGQGLWMSGGLTLSGRPYTDALGLHVQTKHERWDTRPSWGRENCFLRWCLSPFKAQMLNHAGCRCIDTTPLT